MNDYEMCIEKLKQVNLALAYGHANIAKNNLEIPIKSYDFR
jgi:hypothetical protein